MKLLIRAGAVITMDPGRRILAPGAVLIEADRIVAVGDRAGLDDAARDATVIDAPRMVALPGLIDCHAHAGHGLIKSLGADQGDAWYRACETVYTRASPPDFWHAEAALAALERLKAGVTTGVSLLGGGDSILRTDTTEHGARHCDAVAEVGVRNVLAVGPSRGPFPRRYAEPMGAGEVERDVGFEEQLANSRALIERHHESHGGRVRMAVVSPTLRADHLEGIARAAREVLDHQAREARRLSRETAVLFTQDGHTRGSVENAHRTLDLLGPDALLSHSTDLTDEEIGICADTGTSIAHNPSAVASIVGRCPVPELLDAGVTVGLGSDATAPDRSGDMFRHMQQCMHYHRRHFRDREVIPPGKALEMATIDAAHALGMAADVGSLEPGKKADVILLDLYKPHLYPLHMPLYRAAYFANGADVDTVIVDGSVLMQGRRVRSVDEAMVLDRAHAEAELMLDRADLRSLLDTPDRAFGHSHYRKTS